MGGMAHNWAGKNFYSHKGSSELFHKDYARVSCLVRCDLYDKFSDFFTHLYRNNVWVGGVAKWIGCWTQRSEGLGFNSQCWSWVKVSGKLRIPQWLGPSSCNEYLVHKSKVGSIVAGCISVHLAKGMVDAVEHACSWMSGSLPLMFDFESHQHQPSWGVHIGLVLFSKQCEINAY